MMKLSELIDTTARTLEMPNITVANYARALRENGMLTSTGKGGAAADMTCLDKVTLLVATCGCETARQCHVRTDMLLHLMNKNGQFYDFLVKLRGKRVVAKFYRNSTAIELSIDGTTHTWGAPSKSVEHVFQINGLRFHNWREAVGIEK